MQEKYKEWTIGYYENLEMPFVATNDDVELSSPSLKELKGKIDKYTKEKFERIPIYFMGWGGICNAEITSIASQTTSGEITDVWLSVDHDGNKRRSKETIKSYSADFLVRNEANEKRINEIKQLNGEIEKLSKKIDDIRSQLEKFDINKELKKGQGISEETHD